MAGAAGRQRGLSLAPAFADPCVPAAAGLRALAGGLCHQEGGLGGAGRAVQCSGGSEEGCACMLSLHIFSFSSFLSFFKILCIYLFFDLIFLHLLSITI